MLCAAAGRLAAQQSSASQTIVERTATAHPIHYFVSLPPEWNSNKTWPLLVVIPDADREFRKTANAFASARGSTPFVIVVPMILGGGGTAQQHKASFDYPDSVWSIADRVGYCDFDEAGLTAVLDDVHRLYHADSKFFLTGWEAGGHVVIPQLFAHPERLRAVAIVTPNFLGRCVTPATRRLTEAESQIPVRVFGGSSDPAWTTTSPLFTQSARFDSLAKARGFRGVTDSVIRNRGHGALAADVVGYFATLLKP
jgi:poly(3-hydroxybutyrate) depolymerase